MPLSASLMFAAALLLGGDSGSHVDLAIRKFVDAYAGNPVRCRRLDSLRIATPEIDGDAATAYVEAEIATPARHEMERRTFRLRRTSGEWRVESANRVEDDFMSRFASMSEAAQAAALRDEAPTPALADRLAQYAISMVNAGDFAAARRIAMAATELAEATGDALAIASAREAESVLARTGARPDFAASAALAAEAVRYAEASGDADAVARALLRQGRASSDHTEETRAIFERILSLADEVSDASIPARAATQLAQHYNLRSDYRREMSYALLASRYAEQSGDRVARLSALMNVAGAHEGQNDWELALAAWEQALPLARGLPGAEASVLDALALGRSVLYDDPTALDLWDKALQAAVDTGCYPDAAAEILQHRGMYLLGRGKLAEAGRDAVQAFESVKSGSRLADARSADAFELLTMIALYRGRNEDALQMGRASGLNLLAGIAAQRLGRYQEARRLLEAAVSEVEMRRHGVFGTPREHQLFIRTAAAPYLMLCDVLVSTGEVKQALAVVELLKARVLRETLASPNAAAPADREAERELADLNRAMVAARDPRKIASLRRDLAAARRRLLESVNRSALAHSAYRMLDARELTARPAKLEGALASAVVLEYVVADDRTIVFVLKNDGARRTSIAARVLPVDRAEIRRQVKELRVALERRDLDYGKIAASLYARLLAPLEDVLAGAPLVCIVPAEELWQVPFHALRDARGRYLIERSAVLYAPSAALLQSGSARAPAGAPRLLAFANPNLRASTVAQARGANPRAALGAIPETESEVRALARLYGPASSKVYVGDAAREAVLKREAGRADVLHIATHGLVDDQMPMFSALLLSTMPGRDADDGLLEAREIAALHLRTRVAILSACDTAGGNIAPGEGVIGFSWALFAAGCPTAVLSQWKTVSDTTAMLMVRFHRHLLQHDGVPRALQRAQLALMRDPRFAHPYYWAPFVVVGAP